jgi:hypothetical protein
LARRELLALDPYARCARTASILCDFKNCHSKISRYPSDMSEQ